MYYFFSLLMLTCLTAAGQVKIHAHNDYEKPQPLYNALRSKVYSLEADVFLRDGQLLVAHSADQLPAAKRLETLYLEPIAELFNKNKGSISTDTSYRVALMVDIKDGGEETIRQLARLLKNYRYCFDRNRNKNAVLIIISGDRGPIAKWTSYPSYILFDGRPKETYDKATLKRIACISDSYAGYKDSREKLVAVVDKSHQAGKPFRFWGTPDNAFYWKYFRDAGVDFINTDQPAECNRFFEKENARN